MLKFDPSWRFRPPADGRYCNSKIPDSAKDAFIGLIYKVAVGPNRREVIEHFKEHFTRTTGGSYMYSSSEDWAESDLNYSMKLASENAPLFLLALYTALMELKSTGGSVPGIEFLNQVCVEHGIGYAFMPPDLVLRESITTVSIATTTPSKSLATLAMETLEQSLQRSHELIISGHYREAVQECLWVLESLTTSFKGLEVTGDTIKGKYFNQIIADLKRKSGEQTLSRVVDWITALHGFLSSPTGGGVRHGVDLSSGIQIDRNEALLFCNLIRSYIHYLLNEHERLVSG